MIEFILVLLLIVTGIFVFKLIYDTVKEDDGGCLFAAASYGGGCIIVLFIVLVVVGGLYFLINAFL